MRRKKLFVWTVAWHSMPFGREMRRVDEGGEGRGGRGGWRREGVGRRRRGRGRRRGRRRGKRAPSFENRVSH